jgi:glycosyltransferase involved in cell wall biosynthesis
MACGTAVVVSERASLPEVCGSAASYIDPDSIEEITSAMIDLLEDPELRMAYERKGIRQARRFDWRHTAKKHGELFRRLLKEAHSRVS